jgi:Rrf2 family iron-sulfur cluster assembly transcriptional regulator
VKLSTRARYAMHLMIELARRPDGLTSLGEVAQRTRMSRRYLDQLAVALRSAGLIGARPGHGGGYRLARPPAAIRVGAIIEAAIGPLSIVECVRRPESCLKSELCECRSVYALINQKILDLLYGISLADLADREWLRCVEQELDRRGGTGCPGSRSSSTRTEVAHVR